MDIINWFKQLKLRFMKPCQPQTPEISVDGYNRFMRATAFMDMAWAMCNKAGLKANQSRITALIVDRFMGKTISIPQALDAKLKAIEQLPVGNEQRKAFIALLHEHNDLLAEHYPNE